MARYRIVPERSRVWIDARSNVHDIHSSTDGLLGHVDLDTDHDAISLDRQPAGQLSLPVAKLTSGNALEDRELRKRIDAQRFPTIDGQLTDMRSAGPEGHFRVSGDLSFRGVTKRCEDDMTVELMDDRTMRLTGTSRFDIRDFGMQPPRILMLRVEPTVQVRVEILAEKEA